MEMGLEKDETTSVTILGGKGFLRKLMGLIKLHLPVKTTEMCIWWQEMRLLRAPSIP